MRPNEALDSTTPVWLDAFAARRASRWRHVASLSVVFGSFALASPASAQATTGAAADSVQECGDSAAAQLPAARIASDSATRYHAQSFGAFLNRTVGPVTLLRSAAFAGVDQWRRQPVRWMQTSRGYRDRLDTRLGGDVLGHSIRFAIARAGSEYSEKYQECHCGGFEPRLLHALLTPFRVQMPRGLRYSAITPLGVTLSSLAVTSVHPGGFSATRGLESAFGSLSGDALTAAAHEFWPWHWRPPGF